MQICEIKLTLGFKKIKIHPSRGLKYIAPFFDVLIGMGKVSDLVKMLPEGNKKTLSRLYWTALQCHLRRGRFNCIRNLIYQSMYELAGFA